MDGKRKGGRKVVVQAYTYKELTTLYNVSRKTLMSWLESSKEEIGKQKGRCLSPIQVALIFEKLGHPEEYDDE
jgi:hypothetical protein